MRSPLKRLAENGSLGGGGLATLIKAVGRTLDFAIEDKSGMIVRAAHHEPVIWVCWHNRVFILPTFYRTILPSRQGKVMTSASRDGEIIAEVMRRYEAGAVRGSSSKKGREALVGAV